MKYYSRIKLHGPFLSLAPCSHYRASLVKLLNFSINLFSEFLRRCMRILETLLPCSMEALSWSIAFRPTGSWLP